MVEDGEDVLRDSEDMVLFVDVIGDGGTLHFWETADGWVS